MRKRTFIGMLSCFLACMLLAGCGGGPKSKTVVIPESEFGGEAAGGTGHFDVSKIYKLDFAGPYRELLGWNDNERVAAVTGQTEADREIERIDYRYNTRQLRAKLGAGDIVSGLSPDGSFAALYRSDPGTRGWKLSLFNLNALTETVIGDNLNPYQAEWSNNGQYVSYVKYGPDGKEPSVAVFDRKLNRTELYRLPPAWGGKDAPSSLKVSDDGKRALLILSGKQPRLAAGTFKGHDIAIGFERPLTGNSFDFLNNDQIEYIGADGSLTLYDSRNGNIASLAQNVESFQLSHDRKKIVYSTSQGDVHAAEVRGNGIANDKLIFKGLLAVRLLWSPDDGRLLMDGRKMYTATAPAPTRDAQDGSEPLVVTFE
ncbi:WD40 repeat domain-containing protein [Paenibacillus humicola]|uniref:WD40 repeat domain-containing protein n=1 Tax=Paenibacillus humicola TaxID=3110540 RepID=UPI00237A6080|nr:WD40 repeat domain-containing protein [Paenibacillus humicola]